jgi:3-dehydroquinate dehydratase-2
MNKRILIINGPNINLTGKREKGIYGNLLYEEICNKLTTFGEEMGLVVDIFQSNHEGEIIDKIHNSENLYTGIIINAGAYTHYSYAIRDAIASIDVPVLEVHMSNIFKREDFRQKSVISEVCIGHISGFGWKSYLTALYYYVNN